MYGTTQTAFEKRIDLQERPSKTDVNTLIMDYLINEGYPSAAVKFAKEANVTLPVDEESIKKRVDIKDAIHSGNIMIAIDHINAVDPLILDSNPDLHFSLLRLQLVELIKASYKVSNLPPTEAFTPALEFATSQLAPRAPTSPAFLDDLEKTMALLIFPMDKLTPQLQQLIDPKLKQTVADSVNHAILSWQGQQREARLRKLIQYRAWAEMKAREAKLDVPAILQLDPSESLTNGNEMMMIREGMIT